MNNLTFKRQDKKKKINNIYKVENKKKVEAAAW